MFNLGIEFFTGFVELIATFGFLLLAYKFSTLAKHYDVIAFKEISLGFRFVFLSYFVPFITLFIGVALLGDIFEDFAPLLIGLPATACTIIAFWYFFKSVKSIIEFAGQNEAE